MPHGDGLPRVHARPSDAFQQTDPAAARSTGCMRAPLPLPSRPAHLDPLGSGHPGKILQTRGAIGPYYDSTTLFESQMDLMADGVNFKVRDNRILNNCKILNKSQKSLTSNGLHSMMIEIPLFWHWHVHLLLG